jgi:hypothetical protein
MEIEKSQQSKPSVWYVVVGLKGDSSPQWLANAESLREAAEVQRNYLEELKKTGNCGYVTVAKMVDYSILDFGFRNYC